MSSNPAHASANSAAPSSTPDTTPKLKLAADIRALTTALAQCPEQTGGERYRNRILYPDPDYVGKEARVYHSVASLLTIGKGSGADKIAVTGVPSASAAARNRSFTLLGLRESSPADLELKTVNNDSVPPRMSIREVAAEEKRSFEEILDSGDEPVELERHIADVKALILGYWELSTEHQCRARSLIHRRALPQLSKRIENPNKFYRAESGEEDYKWWSILTSYWVQAERIEAEDPVGVLPGAANRDAWRWAVVLSLTAERKKEKEKMDAEEAEGSPGKGEEGKESGDEGRAEKTEEEKKMILEEVRKVIPDTGKVVLTPTVIAGCLKALANCVTAIYECVEECAKPAASDKNWEELDLRLYILNQLLAGSKILEHVLTNKSVSDAIREAAKAFGKFLGDQETEDCVLESRNGGFVFRLLKNIVAWYRAINELLSSPFLKKDVQILVKVISVAPPPTEMTPIMDLVDELAMEEEIIDEVKTQFITKGILTSEGLPQAYSGTIHCEASMMGLMVMMEQDRCPQELVDAAGEDAAEIWAMSDTISHAIGVSTKCCFTCHRLAEYLNDQFPAMWPLKPPGTHEIIHPWSPPFGIPEGVLLNLRKDLMARLQRYIYLTAHNTWVRRENERQPDPSFDLDWEDVVQRVLRGSPDP